jgi:hypothetical protein
MTTRNRELAGIIDDSGNITAGGNLTVSGTTLTSSSTVETHADPLIELNTGAGSNSNDLGFVFERGSTGDNACIIWDESNDGFAVGTTTATGTSTGNMTFTAADFAAGKVTVDNVLINGTTIGHTSDTDLLTFADGVLTVAGEVSMTTLDIGGTNVTSTAAELNILDGVTSTAAELNILDGVTATAAEINFLDGDTSATGTTLASADRVIVNDGGTMKQVALSDFETFFESEIDTFSTIDINGGTIDGATVGANSASSGAFTTLTSAGAINVTNGNSTFITGTSWGGALELRNVNDDVSPAILRLQKTPSSGGSAVADNDYIGGIVVRGLNDAGENHNYVEMWGLATDVSNGSESSRWGVGTWASGTEHAYTLMASAGKVGIGTASPYGKLQIEGNTTSWASAPVLVFASTSTANAAVRDWAIGPADSNYGDFHILQGASTGASPLSTSNAKLTISAAGNVGIGETSPLAPLQITKTTTSSAEKGGLYINDTTAAWTGYGGGRPLLLYAPNMSTSSNLVAYEFGVSGSPKNSAHIDFIYAGGSGSNSNYMSLGLYSADKVLNITGGSQVGIGTTSPSGKLHVDGTSYFTNTMHMTGSGNVQFTGGTYPTFIRDGNNLLLKRQDTAATMVTFTSGGATVASDERLKENITTITGATAKVKQLRGVTHTWKESMQNPDNLNGVYLGLIAQEVETVVPEVVHTAKVTDAEPDAWKSVSYEKLVPLLIETIKELEARITTLEG